MIHALLEKIEFIDLNHDNLEARIADAAAAVGGIAEDVARMLRGSLARLLTLPIGRALATNPIVHREVAFSLRLPLLEVARWLPDLRAEILASSDWAGWVAEAEDGGLRIARDGGSKAADPWVLVQGRIDLIVPVPDGWIVVDWKSDRVTGGEAMERRVTLYKGQMEIYRRAVQSLFGSPVRAQIYFLRPEFSGRSDRGAGRIAIGPIPSRREFDVYPIGLAGYARTGAPQPVEAIAALRAVLERGAFQ